MPISGMDASKKSEVLTVGSIGANDESINRRLYANNVGTTEIIIDDLKASFSTVLNRLPTTAAVYSLSSTSASDTQTLRIYGLDDNLDFQTEDVILTGTTPVVTTKLFKRWYTLSLISGASNNVGTITMTQNGNPVAVMSVGQSFTENGVITVPNGYTAYVTKASAYTGKNVETLIRFRIRPDASYGTIFTTGARYLVSNGLINDEIERPLKLLSGTEFGVTAITETGNGACSALIDIILIKNKV